MKIVAHLTNNHQLKAADELIAKLRIQLGQANAYIDELESNKTINDLKKQNELLQITINAKNKRIVSLEHKLSEAGMDERIVKKNEKIKELEKEVKCLRKLRDNLIYKLLTNDQRNPRKMV